MPSSIARLRGHPALLRKEGPLALLSAWFGKGLAPWGGSMRPSCRSGRGWLSRELSRPSRMTVTCWSHSRRGHPLAGHDRAAGLPSWPSLPDSSDKLTGSPGRINRMEATHHANRGAGPIPAQDKRRGARHTPANPACKTTQLHLSSYRTVRRRGRPETSSTGPADRYLK